MRQEAVAIGYELSLRMSAEEAMQLLEGIGTLFVDRGKGTLSWPNTAVANLSFALTEFLNGRVRARGEARGE